jgi:DNA-binding CsgD family transcriptional regulator
MEIIVHNSQPLSIARLGTVKADGIKKAKAQGLKNSCAVYEYLYPKDNAFSIHRLDALIHRINSATSLDRLPDIIQFDYNDLEQNNISPSELATTINFSYKLTAKRLRKNPKHVILTGRAASVISPVFKDKLEKNNFAGCVMGALGSSMEDLREHISVWKKDNGFWDKRIYQDAVSSKNDNPYDLTFRQEQILHIIRTRGLTNGQIATMLKISESTVKMHVGLILKKHGFKTRMQLVTNMY